MTPDIESLGLLQAQEIMESLPADLVEKAYARPAVAVEREIAKRLRRSTAYRDKSGTLRKNWRARQTPKRYRGVRGEANQVQLAQLQAAPHVHLLERGTAPRRTKRGRHTGRVVPRRFIERALKQIAPRTVPIYTSYLNGPQGLSKVVREAAKRRPRRDRL